MIQETNSSKLKEEAQTFSFGWEVEKQPIYTPTTLIKDRFALVRNDTNHVFSIVSNRYIPF